MKNIACLFLALIAFSCQKKRIEEQYYSNGLLKSRIQYDKNVKSGFYETYFENGYIKYLGQYRNEKKIGRHIVYFEEIEGLPNHIIYYDSLGESEKVLFKRKFNNKGINTYTASVKEQELGISIVGEDKDSVYFKVELLDPLYQNFIFNFSSPIKTNGKGIEKFLEGHVTISLPKNKNINENFTGYINNFDIRPINDSLGVAVGDEILFDQRFMY